MPKGYESYPKERVAKESGYQEGKVQQGNKPVSNGGTDAPKPKRAGS